MDTDSGTPAGFVRLRVGGETFEASRDVLLSEPDSVFVAMLAGEWAQAQSIVFDRDPQASFGRGEPRQCAVDVRRCLSAGATRCTRSASFPLRTHAVRALGRPVALKRVRLRVPGSASGLCSIGCAHASSCARVACPPRASGPRLSSSSSKHWQRRPRA